MSRMSIYYGACNILMLVATVHNLAFIHSRKSGEEIRPPQPGAIVAEFVSDGQSYSVVNPKSERFIICSVDSLPIVYEQFGHDYFHPAGSCRKAIELHAGSVYGDKQLVLVVRQYL